MAIKETMTMNLSVIETIDPTNIPLADQNQNTITHNGLNRTQTNDASSGAGLNAKIVMQGSIVMTAGAATLNLAAGPGVAGPTSVNLTGYKIRHLVIRAKANANPIKIAVGASNGFTGFGSDFALTLDSGKETIIQGGSTQVASGVRTLDITGTGTQGLDFIITGGDN